jgi:outer membrane immunogenic protein
MKKLLLASIALAAHIWPAMAADQRMPILKAPPPPIFSWSGCYIGAQGGWAWGKTHTWDPTSGSEFQPKFDVSGGVAGGEGGCQAQFTQFVVGIETDISWSDKKGTAFDGNPNGNPAIPIQVKEQWLATVRGRFGLAAGQALFYVTGGIATAKVNWQGSLLPPAFASTFVASDNAFMVGGVVGAGIE